MKKQLKFFLVILSIGLLGVACSSKDDNTDLTAPIVGTYKGSYKTKVVSDETSNEFAEVKNSEVVIAKKNDDHVLLTMKNVSVFLNPTKTLSLGDLTLTNVSVAEVLHYTILQSTTEKTRVKLNGQKEDILVEIILDSGKAPQKKQLELELNLKVFLEGEKEKPVLVKLIYDGMKK